jgi:SAM-dependent methyltransferase
MQREPSMNGAKSDEWDAHWGSLKSTRTIFSLLSVATRRFVFQPAVAFYADRFFCERGIFVEMGCGTAESSAKVDRRGRTLIGLDFSAVALHAARSLGRMDGLIQADIFAIPLRSGCLDGIWNLGVMEHFSEPQIRMILREFRRVLKPGGVVLLFWPTEKNASRWVLGPLEAMISRWKKNKFTFFPDEISRLQSKRQALQLMESEGFAVSTIDFNLRTALINMVVAATAR